MFCQDTGSQTSLTNQSRTTTTNSRTALGKRGAMTNQTTTWTRRPTQMMRCLPRWHPMRAETPQRVNSKISRFIIGSHPKGCHNVSAHCPKDPNCVVCKLTKSARARCTNKSRKHKSDARSEKYRDFITAADHKILNVENESRCGHSNALIVDEDTNCIHSYSMKTKETGETTTCLQGLPSPSQKPGSIFTDNSKEA